MSVARELIHAPHVDLFGISGYFGCPNAAFLVFGEIAHLMGGINLNNVRLVHALLGIACVVATYGLFRCLSANRRVAASAAIIMAANHSLIAYSRMAMWSDSALLLEILSLYFLARGFKASSRRDFFLAGVACGFAFYVYFPGRIAIALCFLSLAVLVLLRARPRPLKRVFGNAAVLFAGWLLAAAPVLIATAKNRGADTQYQREQLLIYPEGRAAAERWTGTPTPRAAWIANARFGLGTFNAHVVDHSWLYPNGGHGFVDTLTGILVWIGVIACGAMVLPLRKRRRRERNAVAPDDLDAAVLALTGFAILYVTLALLVTKAPNYQRLLMILPFSSYLAAAGLWYLARASTDLMSRFTSAERSRLLGDCAVALVVFLIVVINISIFRDYTVAGRRNGHEVGSTGRMVAARRNESGHTWILAADKQHLYYFWGEPWWWQGWIGFFAGENQTVEVVPPDQLDAQWLPHGATIFTSGATWAEFGGQFRSDHSVTSVKNVVPDGRLVAIEVH